MRMELEPKQLKGLLLFAKDDPRMIRHSHIVLVEELKERVPVP